MPGAVPTRWDRRAHGNAMVGSAVLGEDRVRVGSGPVKPRAGARPEVVVRPLPGAVGHRTGGERLDPPGGLAAIEQGRGGGHIHALPGTDCRMRVEGGDAYLGPHRDVAECVTSGEETQKNSLKLMCAQ